jgi:hypothetical protein
MALWTASERGQYFFRNRNCDKRGSDDIKELVKIKEQFLPFLKLPWIRFSDLLL